MIRRTTSPRSLTAILTAFALVVCVFLPLSSAFAQGGSGSGLGLKMNGAVGATVINGVGYQYFSFRPDISIGKFGVGLDLSLYFDADGNIRKEDWDGSEDIVDKLYYVRWGQSGDPFYIRVGSLEPITLGYGLMMRRYQNAIEWPSVRRVGMHSEVHAANIMVETVVGNFKEIESPGLVAARFTMDVPLLLPVRFGANIAYDGNQYLGALDTDNDGIPDRLDMFPGSNDGRQISDIKGILNNNLSQIEQLIAIGALPDIMHPAPSIADLKDPVTEIGLDVGVPLIDGEKFSLWAYAQAVQIIDFGRGYTVPGLSAKMGPVFAGVEYRIFEAQFMADYFDMAYETERVFWDEASNSYKTRESTLENLPSAQGIWADAGWNVFGFVDIYGSYQHMSYGGGEPGKSLYAKASLLKKFIPKVTLAEVYFSQPNADKLFSTDADGTVMGYRIGTEVGPGVSLIYDNKSIYHHGKPTRIMTIETALTF